MEGPMIAALLLIAAMWSGEASWYDDGPGLYGAVHSYRWGDPRYPVKVCRADDPDVCVVVTIRDHMANPDRAIDLSPSAFHALWPGLTEHEALILRGVVQVTVTTEVIELPATDTIVPNRKDRDRYAR
jgi:hypothetical protein